MNSSSYLAVLGRQPLIALAELERLFGAEAVRRINESVAVITTTATIPFGLIGGTIKLGRVIGHKKTQNYQAISREAVSLITREYASFTRKLTLGISAYGFDIGPRDAQKTGLVAKAKLRVSGASVRLVPNTETALSSAQSYHNGLIADNKVELMLVRGDDGESYVAVLHSVQDIDFYTERDRKKPYRDALNGMLPPKLAQTMINLAMGPLTAGPRETRADAVLLDPFCGSGTILIEGIFHGFNVYGTDVNPKMIAHSRGNIEWFQNIFSVEHPSRVRIEAGNATAARWDAPITAVVSETYLGEPMSQEPPAEKLARVMEKCESIIRAFLENIASQIDSGTTLCIAVPAWRVGGGVKHLPVVDDLHDLGYNWIDFKGVERSDLLYYREDQIVARELLILEKA